MPLLAPTTVSLFNLLGEKLRILFLGKDVWASIYRIFILLLAGAQALGIALLFNFVDLGDEMMQNTILASVALGVVFSSLMMDFIPSLRHVILFPPHPFPLSRLERGILQIIINEVSFTNIVLLMFLAAILLAPNVPLIFKGVLLLGFVFARLLNFFFRIPLAWAFTAASKVLRYLPAALLVISVGAGIAIILWQLPLLVLLIPLGLGVVSLSYFYFLVANRGAAYLQPRRTNIVELSEGDRLILKRPGRLTKSLIFALLFKCLLGSFVILGASGESDVFQAGFLLAIFISPLTIFTYAQNNYFGFGSGRFYNAVFRIGDPKLLWVPYLKSTLAFVGIDLLLTATLCLILGQPALIIQFAPFYLGSAAMLPGAGLIASSHLPVHLHNEGALASMQTYTHPVGSIICMALVAAYYFALQQSSLAALMAFVLGGLMMFIGIRRLGATGGKVDYNYYSTGIEQLPGEWSELVRYLGVWRGW